MLGVTLSYMSLQVAPANKIDRHRAAFRAKHNNRYAAACTLADVAEAHCRQTGTTAVELAAMPEAGWSMLNTLAGRTRIASDETRELVITIVAERLARAA